MSAEIIMDGAWPDLFDGFVSYKRGLGHAYPKSSVFHVRRLSRHLAGFLPAENVMSQEMAEAFYAPDGRRSAGTLRQRRGLVRQFALFLRWRGIDCWVPPETGEHMPEPRFTPRIITAEEMARIISWADQDQPSSWSPTRNIVFATMIRVLWCCGLRIGEAAGLTVADVDLVAGVLTIRRAKHNHTRLVPMSATLAHDMNDYTARMGLSATDGGHAFFPSRRGLPYTTMAASNRVRTIMAAAGVTTDGVHPPRAHDIRHSYAVHALQKMEADGTDPYTSLPLLSTVMGHRTIQATEYYLRLTGPMSDAAAERMADCYQHTFPEVD